MTKYIVRRVLFLIPILVGILFVTFLIEAFIPADSVAMMFAGTRTDESAEEAMANIRAKYNLDKPWYTRFVIYVWDVLHGDLGISIRTRRPVWDDLKPRYINTIKLTFASLVVAVTVGVSTGVISAYYKDSVFDVLAQMIGLFGLSMPAFFFGIVLIIFFSVKLQWFPVLGKGDWKHLILPAVNMGLISSTSLSRMTRSAMLDVLNQDYIRTARSKGLRERVVVMRHALKNAFLPVVTIIGLQIGYLLGGVFIIENVFLWHGVGELAVRAIGWHDFTITKAIILVSAATYVLVNLAVDIIYGYIDPRIRYN